MAGKFTDLQVLSDIIEAEERQEGDNSRINAGLSAIFIKKKLTSYKLELYNIPVYFS